MSYIGGLGSWCSGDMLRGREKFPMKFPQIFTGPRSAGRWGTRRKTMWGVLEEGFPLGRAPTHCVTDQLASLGASASSSVKWGQESGLRRPLSAPGARRTIVNHCSNFKSSAAFSFPPTYCKGRPSQFPTLSRNFFLLNVTWILL